MPIEPARDSILEQAPSLAAASARVALVIAWLAVAACVGYALIDKVLTLGPRHINMIDLTAALMVIATGALVALAQRK